MSLKKQINWLFIVVFSILVAIYLITYYEKEQKSKELIVQAYLKDAKELYPVIADAKKTLLTKRAKEFNLKEIKGLSSFTIVKNIELAFGAIKVIEHNDKYYLLIEYLDEKRFFKSLEKKESSLLFNLLFLAIAVILLIIYFWVLRLFKPINELSLKLERFSKDKEIKSMSENAPKEIANLAKSFNLMTKELNESLKTKEHILKYIGHEIKTPLAKAKFAYAKGDLEVVYKNLLEIEQLTNSILTMHSVSLDSLDIKSFGIESLIVSSLDAISNIDEDKITVDIVDFRVKGDPYWLKIALKNLIENALKYSIEYPIEIVAKDNQVNIISYGKRLKKDLKFYIEIFNREDSPKDGYGIGLSIVNTILQKHNLKLEYKYINGKNIFYIGFNMN